MGSTMLGCCGEPGWVWATLTEQPAARNTVAAVNRVTRIELV
jgi:hypothetical protein